MRALRGACAVLLLFYLLATLVNCDHDRSHKTAKIIPGKISNHQEEVENKARSVARSPKGDGHVQDIEIDKTSSVSRAGPETRVKSRTPSGSGESAGPLEPPPSRRLIKRALGRGRLSKVALAARPRSTTTTTTTTTTEKAPPEDEAESGEAPAEYEEGDEPETPKEEPKQPAAAAATGAKSQPPASAKPASNKPQQGSGGMSNEKKGRKKQPAAAVPEGADKSSETNETPSNTTTSGGGLAKGKKRKPLFAPSFIVPKNESACTPEAYLEFPRDLIGNKWRARGLVLVHLVVVCYMFYSLALVCERYFMPSLEEFAQRLELSQDVAGATLMSAGSSAPELFTAILGVFVAKGDVGTGAIVGSAGICAFVSTTTAQLNWWPVLRDSVFYTFTVLVLILFIYDERITALESFSMIALYGVYILIMVHNDTIKEQVTKTLQSYPVTAKLFATGAGSVDGPDDVFGSMSSASNLAAGRTNNQLSNYQTSSLASAATRVEDDSMFLAACLIIVQHKRLFRATLRFQFAARYVICKRQHRVKQQKLLSTCSNEVNYFGPESECLTPKAHGTSGHQKERMEAYATTSALSKNKFSIVSKEDYEFWNRPPQEGENYYLWLAKIPVNYVLHYTVPDCTLYPDKYLLSFFVSILWTAFFSYIMVWMVTLIGYTFGIPDSVMGVTFLAAGTSVPDCYSSVHAARNGMANMAVSNSIGSNVFDILIGLSVPWFIQSAIYPGVVATINSRGVIYSVILLFLSLIVTIYLMNKFDWTLKPRLGLALLIAYGLFIVLTCMLEFNLFGHVNPPPCEVK